MDVILLEKISNLGELGDLVSVKPGYARNFLVPQSKAVWATAGAKTRVDERRRELAQLDAERLEVAQAKSDLLPAELTLQRKAGEEGRLFGSVAASDVAETSISISVSPDSSVTSSIVTPVGIWVA